ncbi:lipopolysaccharide biosynthesis protein [Myroides sp. N17-2]|uniref:lipopolysaccharide biosynthesis protein n=1 Tax=Myroides sp. N17-2 TaxID=2030799 RepID=UPI000EFC6FD2|nr:lipopolysaccharide biosynthesis protein [Myroides sp. N17-2]
MSLRGQAIGGVFWTVADAFVLRGMTFIASIILARWLGPSEFGLVGMMTVFIALGTTLTDSGLTASLIRTKERDQRDYTTVFWLNLGMSLFIYIVLFFSAPYIALFFKQEVLVGLIRIYTLGFIISAFSAVQLAKLTANLEFKKIAKLNVPGTIIGTSIGLVLGYYNYGAYAVVYMYLSIQIIQSFMLWMMSNWRPVFSFSKDRAEYHYKFGYKLMLSNVIGIVFQNIYDIIIGRVYSVKVLGYYERSHSFNNFPISMITSVMSKVTYPLLSSIQDDKLQLGIVYRKILRLTFFIVAPLMTIAAAIAEPLFQLMLGDAWLPAVPFFQIICLSTMFFPIHAFNLNVFMVYGRSDLFLKLEVIKKIVIIGSIVIGFYFGIYGLLWGSVVTSYISLIINTHYSADMINYSQKQQFNDMLPILVFALISSGGVFLFNEYVQFNLNIVQVILGSILGGVTYLVLNYLIKSEPLMYSISLIKEKIK